MTDSNRTLIVLAFDLTDPNQLQEIVKQISGLDLPVSIGENHIVINELADKVLELLLSDLGKKICDINYYDENTLVKVHNALHMAGLTNAQINASINSMQNAGILFRERQ